MTRFAGALAVLAAAMLAAGCGGRSSGQGEPGSKPNPANTAVAFVNCLRTHGEPNMPEPDVTRNGGHVNVSISARSGIDPNSQLFHAALSACRHLLPNDGAPSKGETITAADQLDYLEAARCMRVHGVPDFPDPTFRNGDVSFRTQTPIDTNTPEYESALTTCQKLIPAGLPYSRP